MLLASGQPCYGLLTYCLPGRRVSVAEGGQAMAKITKSVVEKLAPGERDVFAWDGELRGFGIRVKPSGMRSYFVQYRNCHGRSKRLTIGLHGRLTAEEARREARLILAEVEKGGDPAEARQTYRNAPTMTDLCDRYLAEHAREHKKASSVAADERNVRNHILPVLGSLKVASVTRADVDRLKRAVKEGKTARRESLGPRRTLDVRGGPGAANRVLALLSKMMNLAEKWGVRPDGSNPCRHIDKFRENRRERFLSANEMARLAEVLAEAERTATELPSAITAIRLLILTGCRRMEILTLRWEHVDFDGARLRLPDSKTGAKVVHLNAPALAVLAAGDRDEDNPWVVRGVKPDTHLVGLQNSWERIRAKAGLDDVRLHDLRHSFASVAVAMGEGLPMIGKLLGHTQTQTTARYAHLAADPVRAANERIGAAIAGMMAGTSAEVVPLSRVKS